MHWQFGGNLEPVQMICEVDWKECPKAIGNYIWSEIVTDVLDCLRNESVVWRVLAVLSVCIVLVRIICSKVKRGKSTAIDKDILNKVGYKVEDLELKVNILTYKLQYGSWPLPHQVQKSNFKKSLRNLRLTISNPNDRNNWIKHVLLSPRRNESYVSYPKYYPSEHHLTELFDAKKKSTHPYLRQENLPVEHSSKSSKSSSDKSLKLNSIFKNTTNHKHWESSRNENLEMQHRNAISLPLFVRRNGRSARKMKKDSKNVETEKSSRACRKFTKSMDDCKRYLKELHDSNKNLGLVCSSSEISNASSVKNVWSDTQQHRCVEQKDLTNSNERLQENEASGNKSEKEENTEEEKNVEKANKKQQNNDNCLELSNAIYPVLQLIDKRLLPPKMNIKFCADMFPQQSSSNLLLPASCRRRKYVKTSQEALYQVKKKLESLHNVLRMYELQNVEAKASMKQRENSNKINSVCQNLDTSVSVTKDGDSWNKNRRINVNTNSDSRNDYKEMQRTTSNSSEQYESDETGRSSMVSVKNYSNMFNTYRVNNINEPYCSLMEKIEPKISSTNNHELEMIPNNQIVYCSNVTYEKIPERIYYAISSDCSEKKDIKRKTTVSENFTSLPDVHDESNQAKSFSFSDQNSVPMETDEDVVMSPTSSRTEVSKDSELEDKSTAVLLQEALQFKKALLTRVELEKVCYGEEKKEETSNESAMDHGRYSCVNNLQSKLLDIISEEQSVSSSTEKTSRTYMFFNLKQDKQFNSNMLNFAQQNEIRDSNAHRSYLDSKHNLDSPSEYFSFSNMIQDRNGINDNQLSLSKHDHFRENVLLEHPEAVSSNLKVKYLNDTLDQSDEKLMKFVSCLNTTETNSEQRTCYDCMHKKESFKEHFARMNDINEFINRNINSVELFSQDLDEAPLEEKLENLNENINSNFLNSESLKQYTNEFTCTKSTENIMSNVKLNVSDDDKYIEDNEILTCNPNLILKRNPGACSLIEQTLMHTNMSERLDMRDMILNEDPIYELSPSESKGTSLETNLIQDSLTSSINQSNDSNIPEPPSVTVLINKSLDEGKLNLNFSDDGINDKGVKSCSTNTITLQKYDITNVDNYAGTEIDYNKNEKLEDEKDNSVAENSFTNLGKKESINEADFYKSYSNLVSPHSSMYFTDEASSSITKLNNTYSKNFKDLHSNLYTQNKKENKVCCENENLKDTGNIETLSVSMLNEIKKINVTTAHTDKSSIKVFNNESSESNNKTENKNDSFSSKTCTENTGMSLFNETKKKETQKKENETINDKSSTCYNDTDNYNSIPVKNISTDRTPSRSPRNDSEKLNMEQYVISSNLSPRLISPRETKENNASKRMNSTVKSRSHENYNSKSEKFKRQSAVQNVKGLKSDSLNTVQTKTENNTNTTYTKLRDLSAERRRNTEDNIKLDKKRSRSQVSFRTNESSKEATSQSPESPNATNLINCNESLETKLKSKGHLKSLSPTPKTSSRSCIPILKSRLEAARKSENESRPKSPVRGPLTMTMFWKDKNQNDENENVMDEIEVEGKSKCVDVEEINSSVEKPNDNGNHKQDSMKALHAVQNENTCRNIVPQEQMIIYVNIFTKYDHNATKIVDPNKFLEFVKNRKLNKQKVEENLAIKKDGELGRVSGENERNERNAMHKIVTVVSSVINGNELNQTTSTNLSALKTQNDSLSNILLNGKLKNLCFLSVEQREIDVTAKPSVIDTSTSISDLENISGTSRSALNKFQICGTPKELNNEEYIALLEILNQEPNFVHLQELQNVCKKLVSEQHLKI